MDFKIVNVFEQDCHLVAQVEHYHPDGSFWHLEHYRWQGREGLKHGRQMNARGQLLMDNGEVAPLKMVGRLEQAYLPVGRAWARESTPYLNEECILQTIRSVHADRLVSGWPQGSVDILGRTRPDKLQEDWDGCAQLVTKFAYLKGLAR